MSKTNNKSYQGPVMRGPFVVTLILGCLCLAEIGTGILIALSPLMINGGIVGWLQGYEYDRNYDILLLESAAGLVYGLLSVGLGIIVAVVSGFVGVWMGIASAILGLARGRSRGRAGSDEADGRET